MFVLKYMIFWGSKGRNILGRCDGAKLYSLDFFPFTRGRFPVWAGKSSEFCGKTIPESVWRAVLVSSMDGRLTLMAVAKNRSEKPRSILDG